MRVLWTFNPFDKNKELHKLGKKILDNLFDKKDTLEAIYVASSAEVELATSYNIPANKRYSDFPKKLIKDQLKKLSLMDIDVEVLSEKSLSLTSTVKKVVEYSKKKKFDLIVIATNSKKLLPRFVFGSFAESIVHLAICDLLIYHQKIKFNSKTPSNIIYAHDFSTKGTIGLERAVEYVKKWNSALTIVHIPVPEIGMDLQEFKEKTQKQVQKIEKLMKNQDINYKIYLEYEIMPISDIILNIARKTNGSIIAVAAQSNKLSALLGGSITRQILRESLLPTLVLKI
jgi:nucleotide-binding universal stress UspA family protein